MSRRQAWYDSLPELRALSAVWTSAHSVVSGSVSLRGASVWAPHVCLGANSELSAVWKQRGRSGDADGRMHAGGQSGDRAASRGDRAARREIARPSVGGRSGDVLRAARPGKETHGLYFILSLLVSLLTFLSLCLSLSLYLHYHFIIVYQHDYFLMNY